MKSLTAAALLLSLWSCQSKPPESADYPYRPVPFTDVRLSDSFWAPRIETNRMVTIPINFRRCEETGRIDNFLRASGQMEGEYEGQRYNDSDVYKVIEGASYSLGTHPDAELDAYLDDLIGKIAAAQESDGYLFAIRTTGAGKDLRRVGEERWSYLVQSHELYNVGHLYEAAAAHFQATGKRTLLDVALKNANFIVDTFGPDGIRDVPGHEEIEIGLAKLYRVTGDHRYLRLAKFFVDERGNPERHTMELETRTREYSQDHLPVKQQSTAVGHAVRAGYFYSGATDIAALTGEPGYREALDRIWTSVVDRRMYLTGGVGAHRHSEGFGEDHELPNDLAYNETCAAIASGLWNHRLYLLDGDARYIDVLERVLYNGFLSGVSLSGDLFFYPNPLAADGKTAFNQGAATRKEWFGTSCCPGNVARIMPSIPGYVYAIREADAFVNLYVAGEGKLNIDGQPVRLEQRTSYPWEGDVEIAVHPDSPARFAINLRIPGWVRNEPVPSDLYTYTGDAPAVSIRVNGEAIPVTVVKGYVRIEREWREGDAIELELPMEVRRVKANEAVEADRGRVALERGPLVYCAEGIDNGGSVDQITVGSGDQVIARHRAELLGGVTVLEGKVFTAIPYYAWSNRGVGPMAVWLRAE